MGLPVGRIHCAKQIVTATLVTRTGRRYVGHNHRTASAPKECPRGDMPSGVGYDLCKDVCEQVSHAEVDAIFQAGADESKGSTIYLEGHTYACNNCKSEANAAGVKDIVVVTSETKAALYSGNVSGLIT